MDEEVVLEHEGETYTASYSVSEDTLIVCLPDGSLRYTELRGLKAESSTLGHLRAYVSTNT